MATSALVNSIEEWISKSCPNTPERKRKAVLRPISLVLSHWDSVNKTLVIGIAFTCMAGTNILGMNAWLSVIGWNFLFSPSMLREKSARKIAGMEIVMVDENVISDWLKILHTVLDW